MNLPAPGCRGSNGIRLCPSHEGRGNHSEALLPCRAGFPLCYNKPQGIIKLNPLDAVGDMKRFRQKSGVVTRNIGGETIIVPVEAHVCDLDSVFTLNEVGSAVWELLDGRTSLDQIVAAVCKQYEVAPEEARRDVAELIDSLAAAGLIHPSDEA